MEQSSCFVCNTVALVNFHRSLRVMRSWCWCMMYNGLCHLAVSIEADIAAVVSTLVGHEHRWTVIVEMASVVVRVHCECPAACLPCHRTFPLCSCIELVKYAEIPNCCDVKCLADGISYLIVSQ